MFIRLPTGRDLELDILQAGMGFLGRHRRVQHVDQSPHDALFLSENRASSWFRGVRGEHWLDVYIVQQRLKCVQAKARRFQFYESLFNSNPIFS